jgi:MmgE/PrpD N-terminal domain
MPRYQPSAFALGGAGSCLGWPVWTPGGSGGMKANAPAASLTRSFTDLLSAWPADDPALQDQCRLLLLDGLAVAVAGAAAERGPGLMAAQARSKSPDGPSMVIGQGFTTSVVNAGRVNGMARCGWTAGDGAGVWRHGGPARRAIGGGRRNCQFAFWRTARQCRIYRPPDLIEISMTLRRDQFVDQAQIGAGK